MKRHTELERTSNPKAVKQLDDKLLRVSSSCHTLQKAKLNKCMDIENPEAIALERVEAKRLLNLHDERVLKNARVKISDMQLRKNWQTIVIGKMSSTWRENDKVK